MWIPRQIEARLLELARTLVCRAPHRFPLGNGAEAMPLIELASNWAPG